MLCHSQGSLFPIFLQTSIGDLCMLHHGLVNTGLDKLSTHNAQPNVLGADAVVQVQQVVIFQTGYEIRMELIIQSIEVGYLILTGDMGMEDLRKPGDFL